MPERLLPSAQLVKAGDWKNGYRSSYDVIGTSTPNEGQTLGYVIREHGAGLPTSRRSWKAYLIATAGEYGSGLHVVKGSPFHSRQEALIAVLQSCQAQEAELHAHEVVDAMATAVTMAEKQAAEQVAARPNDRLIPTFLHTQPFSVSTRVVREELETHRNNLRNRLTGLKPFTRYYLSRTAYLIRMYELELERRSQTQNQPQLNARQPRCEAHARRGTGTGICDAVLDEHGNCPRPRDHIEVN